MFEGIDSGDYGGGKSGVLKCSDGMGVDETCFSLPGLLLVFLL